METDDTAAGPHGDLIYGIPLEDALERFTEPRLTAAIDAAWRAWVTAGRPASPSIANVATLLAGGGAVAAPHATRVALFEAYHARCDSLRAQLAAGELELHWTTDPVSGDWQHVRMAAWQYLLIRYRPAVGHALTREAGTPTLIWPRGVPRPKRRLWALVRQVHRPTDGIPPQDPGKEVPPRIEGGRVSNGEGMQAADHRTLFNWSGSNFDQHFESLLNDFEALARAVGEEQTFLQYACTYAKTHVRHRDNPKMPPVPATVKKHLTTRFPDWKVLSCLALSKAEVQGPTESEP